MPKSRGFYQRGGSIYDGGLPESQWGGARTRRTRRAVADVAANNQDLDFETSNITPLVSNESLNNFDTPPPTPEPVAGPSAPRRSTRRSAALAAAANATVTAPVRRGRAGRDAAYMASIRPSPAQLRASNGGIYNDQNHLNTIVGITRNLRSRGRTVPHSTVCGWIMHGNKSGNPRPYKRGHMLRQGIELALRAHKKGYKSLSADNLARMRIPNFPDYQRGAGRIVRRGQRGGLLPLAAAVPALIAGGKALGLGVLGGGGAALGGGLIGKLFGR